MNSNKVGVFIDTSGFKALIDQQDEFHSEAIEISQNLTSQGFELITSNYILDEAWTLIRIKCGLTKAKLLKKYIQEATPLIKIIRVSVKDEINAWNWFAKTDWSGLSFTDCVTFAQMKRLGLKRVFCFDKHFLRAGFSPQSRD